MRNKALLEIARTEPLIKEVIASELDDPCNLMLGIGLANCKVSYGLPLDSLSMIFVAELLRRKLDIGRNYLLIADSCACQNGVQREDVNRLAENERRIFQNVVDCFGFDNWEITRTSELEEGNKEFALILEEVREAKIPEQYEALQHKTRRPFPNEYVARQLSEMHLLRTRFDAKIKVGWKMPGSTLDERVFDSLYTEIFGQDMSFVYVECGKTLNPKKPNAPPYLASDSGERIILTRGESVETKLNGEEDERIKDYRSLLGRIGGLYKKLLCGFTTEEVAQNIIDKVCYDAI